MQYEQTKELFEKLFNNKMSENEAREFLVSLYKQGETSDDIRAAMEVMQEHSIKLDLEDSLRNKIIDVVGTGGDKSNTFNISSTVALLISSTGSIVAKHGNRSITSKSGSADMLEALGIRLDLNLEQSKTLLQECGFTFLFAQNHHPAMKHIMPIRKSLSHRTIFNILGPLTNPAGAKKYFLGVYDKEFVPKIAKALFDSKIKSALVFSSYENMDELGLEKPNLVYQITSSAIKDFELSL
jgi:anthranilate phosphoribosyltransferase